MAPSVEVLQVDNGGGGNSPYDDPLMEDPSHLQMHHHHHHHQQQQQQHPHQSYPNNNNNNNHDASESGGGDDFATSGEGGGGALLEDNPNHHITKPGKHDVLLGRGGGTNNHAGNVKFRKLVNEHKMRYLACSKVDKPKVAREVVQLWRKLDPPGRFLARKDDTKRGPGSVKAADNVWFEVGDKKAREKASQCLRERTPDVLPYIKQLRQQQDAITEHGVSMVQQQLAMQQEQQQQQRFGGAGGMQRGVVGGAMSSSHSHLQHHGASSMSHPRQQQQQQHMAGHHPLSPMSSRNGGGAGMGGMYDSGPFGSSQANPSSMLQSDLTYSPTSPRRGSLPVSMQQAGPNQGFLSRRSSLPAAPSMMQQPGGPASAVTSAGPQAYMSSSSSQEPGFYPGDEMAGAGDMSDLEYQHNMMIMQQQMHMQQMQMQRLRQQQQQRMEQQRMNQLRQQQQQQQQQQRHQQSRSLDGGEMHPAAVMSHNGGGGSFHSQGQQRQLPGAAGVRFPPHGDSQEGVSALALFDHEESHHSANGHGHDPLMGGGGGGDMAPAQRIPPRGILRRQQLDYNDSGDNHDLHHHHHNHHDPQDAAAPQAVASNPGVAAYHRSESGHSASKSGGVGGEGSNHSGSGNRRRPRRGSPTAAGFDDHNDSKKPITTPAVAAGTTPPARVPGSSNSKRSRDVPAPERKAPAPTQSLMSVMTPDGEELTIEEYRQQLELYLENNQIPTDGNVGLSGHDDNDDDDESDLEDDWEKEKEKAYHQQEQERKRGVGRNISGISMMSAKTTKSASGMSLVSGFSGLSDLMSTTSRDLKMQMARSVGSNISLMSDMTDLSQTVDDLSLNDDHLDGGSAAVPAADGED